MAFPMLILIRVAVKFGDLIFTFHPISCRSSNFSPSNERYTLPLPLPDFTQSAPFFLGVSMSAPSETLRLSLTVPPPPDTRHAPPVIRGLSALFLPGALARTGCSKTCPEWIAPYFQRTPTPPLSKLFPANLCFNLGFYFSRPLHNRTAPRPRLSEIDFFTKEPLRASSGYASPFRSTVAGTHPFFPVA